MNPSIERRTRASGWLLNACLVAALTACGGDDDPPPVVAGADTLTIALGQSGNLLANDSFDGQPATVGSAGNVRLELGAGTLPAGVTLDGGSVAVAATAVPGSFTFSYRICDADDSGNCATAAVQVSVPAPLIVAVADSFNLAAGGVGDVLANDTLGGAAASATTVTASTATPLAVGITLSNAGLIGVAAGAVPGSYAIDYRICQTIAPANCAAATATVVVPSLAMITGRAIDAATGLGVAGVGVRSGTATATTDAGGSFTLSGVATAERVVVAFSSAAYVESARVVDAGAGSDVQVRLVPIATTAQVDVAAGGTVTVPGSTAQVVLPAGSVQRADGSVPTGSMTVALTPIDPASDSSVMPGDFTTLVAAAAAPIESFGAVDVRLTAADGAALNLRPGQSATVRIPLSSRNTDAPETIPLYFFDPTGGRWVEEGRATLAGSGSGRYYEGTVGHFTTWNADQTYTTVRVTGCVVDAAGVRVGRALVASDGIDYTGTSSTFTDAGGSFTVPLRLGSVATLTSLSGSMLSNTLRVGPYAADTTLTECLTLGQTGAGITIKLTWGAAPRDLDSHLYAPDGSHVYYGRRGSLTSAPFANLDVDDTSSFGPEVATLTRLMVGTYRYAVQNFSGYGAGPIAASGARVELNVPGRNVELFAPPATGESASTGWWNLFEFDVDASCTVTLRRVNAYASTSTAAPAAPAVYCTAP